MSFVGVVVFALPVPEFLTRQVFLAVHHDIEFGGGDARPIHARKLQRCSDVQVGNGLLEKLEGNSGVEQGAQKHVAANTGEAIEIGNAHESRQFGVEKFIIGKA
jgi:hypothetical protein